MKRQNTHWYQNRLNMSPARHIALGVLLACALGLCIHHIVTSGPRPPLAARPSPSASTHSISPASPLSPPASVVSPQSEEAPASTAINRIELVRRCLRVAETDPLAAMELAIAQKLTADDPGLLSALILRWAERDFSGALDWIRAQPRDAARDDILAHLAFLRSQNAPAAAAEIAAAEIDAPRARAEAILSVVHQWAHRAPEAALAWSAQLADADLRRRAIEDIAATQAQRQLTASGF
jgi:hypothetical protein